ncbi:MAG: ribosome small subunit-dependent GTPase A [Burkholderiaceae bacterium]|nr:ribosome small subunit-dependent GTPase A [Burkholderiaceae bacterium]
MPSSGAAATSSCDDAVVAASFGRQLLVRSPSGQWPDQIAVTRARRSDLCVGDQVRVRQLGAGQAVIESLQRRRNVLQRSDHLRRKLLAANVDQAGVVIAGEPPFSEALLVRMLIAIETAGIDVALIVNKHDLAEAQQAIEPRLAIYHALGYRLIRIAAGADPAGARASLGPWLAGRTTLLLGQSGMGKSTLVNALVPDADLRTQAISAALSSGRHTTTFSRMFEVPASLAPQARIIDTPGFQSFGLEHLSESQRTHAMREFVPLLGRCRFNDCRHRDEPGCAIRGAVEDGTVDAIRHRLYLQLGEQVAAG